jgi:hypothetical protein
MEFTAALWTDLAMLTEAVDEPGLDLVRALQQLISATRLAVDGYLGISLQLTAYGEPVTLTTLEAGVDPSDVSASLAWSPTKPSPASDDAVLPKVVVYARSHAAFLGLIAELRSPGVAGSDGLAIDQHLGLPAQSSGMKTTAVVSQAIGALIDQGRTASEALDELDDHAASAGVARIDIARQVLYRR